MDAELLTDAGVSEREAEVLTLVGQRLTNAEIGGHLFISVRTVESHVSSLLRKLGMSDRRALADLAASLDIAPATEASPPTSSLPSPLTSFVGRDRERAVLADVLAQHRLVTAVGPGGVGKTRLAQAVASDVTARYRDGAWYVDLVPVTDPDMVGATVASTLGFGEQPGRSPTETAISKLAAAQALIVLDNCEHVRDGVAAFVERLLSTCPSIVVLATSRARLLVPFEFVFSVPGLSLDEDGRAGDAVTLFIERAAMAGWKSSYADDRKRIGAVCAALDGLALAVELAAARVAAFGLDGLEAGLTAPLELLTGGPRLHERHRSVRAALDWSIGLLSDDERAVLRRASVFAAPFSATAAADVVGHGSVAPDGVAAVLARLADDSLLVVHAARGETRYRMLETIRQYGTEQMSAVGELDAVRARHLAWCLTSAAELERGVDAATRVDDVIDDLRAGLAWATAQPTRRVYAHALAECLARVLSARGMPSEAQRRYEDAAMVAPDARAAARDLHLAAAVAWSRLAGNDALRLYRAAATAARQAGNAHQAALELMTAAELIGRCPGTLSSAPDPTEQQTLLDEARVLAGGDPHIEAATLTVMSICREIDPVEDELADRAAELARRVGDPRLESAALDQLTAAQLAHGEFDGAAATIARRVELVGPYADDIEMAYEWSDVLHMAPMVYVAAGDLATARHFAQRRHDLPMFREADHLAVPWLLTIAALAGDFDDAVELGARFRRAWVEVGRPPIGGLAFVPAAAAMVHGIRGDDDERRQWLRVVVDMRRVLAEMLLQDKTCYVEVFDGMVALHRGDLDGALMDLADPPQSYRRRQLGGTWRAWYAALWAEVAVLAETSDRRHRIEEARFVTAGHPVASAIVDRAYALAAGDTDRLLTAAAAFHAAGCSYQRARTLVLAGGDAARQGEAILAAIGAAAMVV